MKLSSSCKRPHNGMKSQRKCAPKMTQQFTPLSAQQSARRLILSINSGFGHVRSSHVSHQLTARYRGFSFSMGGSSVSAVSAVAAVETNGKSTRGVAAVPLNAVLVPLREPPKTTFRRSGVGGSWVFGVNVLMVSPLVDVFGRLNFFVDGCVVDFDLRYAVGGSWRQLQPHDLFARGGDCHPSVAMLP